MKDTWKIGAGASLTARMFRETGVEETFCRLKEMGISTLELPLSLWEEAKAEEILEAKDIYDMEICSMVAAVQEENGTDEPNAGGACGWARVLTLAELMGCAHFRSVHPKPEVWESRESALSYIRDSESAACNLAKHGVAYSHQTWIFECTRYGMVNGIELLMGNSSFLKLAVQPYWIQYGGLKPKDIIERYQGREEILYLEDYQVEARDPSAPMKRPEPGEPSPNAKLLKTADIGEGNFAIPSLLSAADAAGIRRVLIEKEYLYGGDVWDSLRVSCENLRRMGFSGHF